MLKNYKGYGDVQVGDYRPLPAGGYVLVIKDAKVQQSRSGKDMLVISYDIAEGEFKGYYEKLWRGSERQDKKWGGVHYIVLPEDGKEGTDPYKWAMQRLKAFHMALNESNGIEWNMDEKSLKGKLVGALMHREQYENKDDELKWSTKVKTFRSAEKIRLGEYEVPEDKLLVRQEYKPYEAFTPDDSEEDLPF